jgi:uncharacterized protein YbjT (DUF2867 family)
MSSQPHESSSENNSIILVTAATAPVGRSIVEQLVTAGRPVRAITRDPGKAGLPAGAEVVTGDLGDAASLAAAMQGVSAVFLLAVMPGFEVAFIKAAREAGVRRIVFQSTGAIDDSAAEQPNSIAAFHYGIEQALKNSGLEYTFLRLAVESSDAIQWAFDVPGQLKKGDVVRGPYAQAANSPIHPADFAAVAITALTIDEHAGKVYNVTGPQSLTHSEEIELIGKALNRPLRYEELDLGAARAAISPYAPAHVLFETWQKHLNTPAPVNDTVQRLTGQKPRLVEEWAADYAANLS